MHSTLFMWSVQMLHKTQSFAPFDSNCWYNQEPINGLLYNVRKMNKDNLSYVFSVVFCVFVVSYLYSFFLHYINICDQNVQNSLSYEASLPITWIKPSTGVTKYDASETLRWLCFIRQIRERLELISQSSLHDAQ